ncbi:response regulator receiver and ANTAR domain protein [Azospirillum brasilense]|uniref:Response regulator receiver and ANTAR domain protein n=1 Tax=Azospirillum brasilense TaxID=192 RepID=A0A560ATY6_AZOBR|nr:ANTAR domain-containing protein [Azospirillum brasilense]TWA63732.1 response regulator receiver and ANTAR domain protein [Azospirillum brasilense]
MANKPLTILVAGPDAAATRPVEDGLAGAGGHDRITDRITVLHGFADLPTRAAALAPDALVAVLETSDAAALDGVFRLARSGACAVVLFADTAPPGAAVRAAEAGVAAFVLDGLHPARVRPILETALARFAAFETLKRERDEARAQLAERKLIERAKGILMQRNSLTEEAAYNALRKAAMKQGRRVADIAQSVITAAQIEL